MKFVYQGASIECESAEIISRKILLSSFQEIPNVGRCKKYNCTRNSEATITKELNPKAPLYSETSHLNLGDMLEAENIVVFVNQANNLKVIKIDNTHRHNAQQANTNSFTYAEITMQFPNFTELKDPKQVKPAPQKLGKGKGK
ncbi:MAG: hypothetical protein ABI855_07110 [Bacteroidota bacterium]